MRLLSTMLCAAAIALAVCGVAGAAPADLDTSFGGDGVVEVEGPTGQLFPGEAAGRLAVGPQDEAFVLYSNYPACEPPFDCRIELTVARYGVDGRRDPAFASGPQLTVTQDAFHHGFDLAVGADGRPVIAAIDEAGAGLQVARLGLDGRLDPTFGSGGIAVPAPEGSIRGARRIPSVAVQPDGKVIVAGEGNSEGASSELIVARYLADGTFDSGFGSGGEVKLSLPTRSLPAGAFVGPAGTLTVPGPRCCFGGPSSFGNGFSVARLLSNGQPDPGWAGDGSLLFPVATADAQSGVEAATLGPDGKLIVSYEESTEAFGRPGNLLRFMPDGTLDAGFGEGGRTTTYLRVGGIDTRDLAVDPEGRIVGVGWAGGVSVFRLRPDGGTDRTFNGGQYLSLPYGGRSEVGLRSGGRILVLAEASGCCGVNGFALVALRGGADGTKCLGKRATIVGTGKHDEITGTPRRDVIAALGGPDEVRALGGADLVCGGKGRDALFGGAGKDRLQQDPVRKRSR